MSNLLFRILLNPSILLPLFSDIPGAPVPQFFYGSLVSISLVRSFSHCLLKLKHLLFILLSQLLFLSCFSKLYCCLLLSCLICLCVCMCVHVCAQLYPYSKVWEGAEINFCVTSAALH